MKPPHDKAPQSYTFEPLKEYYIQKWKLCHYHLLIYSYILVTNLYVFHSSITNKKKILKINTFILLWCFLELKCFFFVTFLLYYSKGTLVAVLAFVFYYQKSLFIQNILYTLTVWNVWSWMLNISKTITLTIKTLFSCARKHCVSLRVLYTPKGPY